MTFTTEVWLPCALQDPVLFISTMAFAAVYLESVGIYRRSSKSLSYKSQTIKAINANLQSPGKAVSDSTIGAVTMLMAMQVSAGQCPLSVSIHQVLIILQSLETNDGELRLHSSALQTMTKMRGGIDTLGLNGALK